VERVFWNLMAHRSEWNDTWMSCLDFVRSVSERYVKAGLLPVGFGSETPSGLGHWPRSAKPVREMAAQGIYPEDQ
jgi:hypothetical protein